MTTGTDLPVTSLRYFTVYGPAQRPDMAIHRLIESAMSGDPFPVFGDGAQIRDFTFVSDVVNANILAATADLNAGTVINIAGGGATSLADLIDIVGEAAGQSVPIHQQPAQAGDVRRTGGSTELAQRTLGWTANVSIEEGVRRQAAWHLARHS